MTYIPQIAASVSCKHRNRCSAHVPHTSRAEGQFDGEAAAFVT